MLGDIAYENGSESDFANCFEPSWGKLVPRIKAALGNHEYNTPGAAPAFKLFGLPPNGWYSYSLGAWHVIVLNSNCSEVGGCGRDSPQARWLEADLAAHPARCTLAYWHHPRFSSGIHGSNVAYAPFWDILARAKADLVLQGHDHDYERFAPLKGIRSFVVGTGGKSHTDAPPAPRQRRPQQQHVRRAPADAARRPATTGSSSPPARARSPTPARAAAAEQRATAPGRRCRSGRTPPARRAAPSRDALPRPARGPASSRRHSSTRPCVRSVTNPKSSRKSRGNTVRWTRKRILVDSRSG